MTWAVKVVGSETHVLPNGDLREHESANSCWCNPSPDSEVHGVHIHHSMDRREDYEPDAENPLPKH